MHKTNFLTFDIEEWYHANYDDVEFSNFENGSTDLEKNIDKIIELCDRYNVKSTCFVLGKVAESKPHIIKKLYRAGHEIASHGYAHKLVYTMTEKEFKEDLKISCKLLEDIIGEKVVGYRAPSWSVKKENLKWYYKVLQEQGIKYSSSIYPAHTYLYGIPGFKERPHYPTIGQKQVSVLEIPVPTFGFSNKLIGFSGGFYLRFFPGWVIEHIIKWKNKNNLPIFIYLHPRELDSNQMKLNLNLLESFIHYHGVKSAEKKLNRLVCSFRKTFMTLRSFNNYM
jgi:peptidoglycan-N-acetylglucosamine deacetylase